MSTNSDVVAEICFERCCSSVVCSREFSVSLGPNSVHGSNCVYHWMYGMEYGVLLQGGIKGEGAVSRPIPTQAFLTNPSPIFQNSELPAVIVWCSTNYRIVQEIPACGTPSVAEKKVTP